MREICQTLRKKLRGKGLFTSKMLNLFLLILLNFSRKSLSTPPRAFGRIFTHDPRLPPGWGRSVQKADTGECFVVIFDEVGRQFRSREEIRSVVISKGLSGIDPSKVDFSVFGQTM